MNKSLLGFVLAAALINIALAQKEATGQREILLQSEQSWNGLMYKSYPAGRP